MIKAGDEVVALVTQTGFANGFTIVKGSIYEVTKSFTDCDGLNIILKNDSYAWVVEVGGTTYFRKVTRPLSSASSEITKKLTEEVREGEKRREIEYEPATATK